MKALFSFSLPHFIGGTWFKFLRSAHRFYTRLFAGPFWSVWNTSWTLDAVIWPARRLFQTIELLWRTIDFSINLTCSGLSFTTWNLWWNDSLWSLNKLGSVWNLIQHAREGFLFWSCCWHKSFSRWILFHFCWIFIKLYFFFFGTKYFFTKWLFHLHKTSIQAASLLYPMLTAASILKNNAPKCEHDSLDLIKNEHKLLEIACFSLYLFYWNSTTLKLKI